MMTVRPVLTEASLGPSGWHHLHTLRRQQGISAAAMAIKLVRYALFSSLAGYDIDLRPAQRAQLEAPFNVEVAA